MAQPLRTEGPVSSAIAIYDQSAHAFAELYESTYFERVHADLIDLLPAPGASVLDVGAGSGRDAAGLARRGYHVTAVEPSDGLRTEAQRRHAGLHIEWIDDRLPGLHLLGQRAFDFILISAVWMHLAPAERQPALQRLASLLRDSGILAISLRQGPADPTRAIVAVDVEDIVEDATATDFQIIRRREAVDTLKRDDVTWTSLILEKALG